MSGKRIVLADDHSLVRAGIRTLIEQSGATVVAEAESGREALAMVRKHTPDVLVTDISMGSLDGLELISQVVVERPEVRCLVLSMHSSDEFVGRALRVGARGYLVKDSAPTELALAIEAVLRDEIYVSPRISRPFATPRVVTMNAPPVAVEAAAAGEASTHPAEERVRTLPSWIARTCYVLIALALVYSLRKMLEGVA